MCVCVCVCVNLPALFPAYLPCRQSQSPLSRLFLFSDWPQCLGICSCADQVTQSIFFFLQKDILSCPDDSMENTQQSGQHFCLLSYKSPPAFYLESSLSRVALAEVPCIFRGHWNIFKDSQSVWVDWADTATWQQFKVFNWWVWTTAKCWIYSTGKIQSDHIPACFQAPAY